MDLSKRADFEGDKKKAPAKIEKLERELKKIQKDRKFKEVESRFDEEHNLWEVRYVNSQGAEHLINWELASAPEYRQLLSKFKQIGRIPRTAVRGRDPGQGRPCQRQRRNRSGRSWRRTAERRRARRHRKGPEENLEGRSEEALRRSRRSSRRPRPASSSNTSSPKAAKTSPCSATKAWEK